MADCKLIDEKTEGTYNPEVTVFWGVRREMGAFQHDPQESILLGEGIVKSIPYPEYPRYTWEVDQRQGWAWAAAEKRGTANVNDLRPFGVGVNSSVNRWYGTEGTGPTLPEFRDNTCGGDITLDNFTTPNPDQWCDHSACSGFFFTIRCENSKKFFATPPIRMSGLPCSIDWYHGQSTYTPPPCLTSMDHAGTHEDDPRVFLRIRLKTLLEHLRRGYAYDYKDAFIGPIQGLRPNTSTLGGFSSFPIKGLTLLDAQDRAFRENETFVAASCFGFYENQEGGYTFLTLDRSWSDATDPISINQPWRYTSTDSLTHAAENSKSYNPGKMFFKDDTFTGKLYIKNKLVSCAYDQGSRRTEAPNYRPPGTGSSPGSSSKSAKNGGVAPLVFGILVVLCLVIVCPMLILLVL
jgi:hypothetical protein